MYTSTRYHAIGAGANRANCNFRVTTAASRRSKRHLCNASDTKHDEEFVSMFGQCLTGRDSRSVCPRILGLVAAE
jgi:hypothetical protein